MKDLIYSAASFVVGLIIGLLITITTVAVGLLWFVTDSKKSSKPAAKRRDYFEKNKDDMGDDAND